MSIQGINTKGTIITPTGLIPMKDFTIDIGPELGENPASTTNIQEGLRLMSQGFTITMQGVVQAFTTAFKPLFDVFRQLSVTWAQLQKKKRHSKQTRAFLATKYKEPHFTPHAQRRRRSQRRMRVARV